MCAYKDRQPVRWVSPLDKSIVSTVTSRSSLHTGHIFTAPVPRLWDCCQGSGRSVQWRLLFFFNHWLDFSQNRWSRALRSGRSEVKAGEKSDASHLEYCSILKQDSISKSNFAKHVKCSKLFFLNPLFSIFLLKFLHICRGLKKKKTLLVCKYHIHSFIRNPKHLKNKNKTPPPSTSYTLLEFPFILPESNDGLFNGNLQGPASAALIPPQTTGGRQHTRLKKN